MSTARPRWSSPCSTGGQAARRRTSQMVTAIRSADSTTSQPVSIHWKGQNRVTGW
ncbi:MAG: hypothetical protein ACRDPY_47810 [Streptosporangiaceae bacterium]